MGRTKFDSDPVFDDKYSKTKIKSYNKINTNFHGKAPKERFEWVCLSASNND